MLNCGVHACLFFAVRCLRANLRSCLPDYLVFCKFFLLSAISLANRKMEVLESKLRAHKWNHVRSSTVKSKWKLGGPKPASQAQNKNNPGLCGPGQREKYKTPLQPHQMITCSILRDPIVKPLLREYFFPASVSWSPALPWSSEAKKQPILPSSSRTQTPDKHLASSAFPGIRLHQPMDGVAAHAALKAVKTFIPWQCPIHVARRSSDRKSWWYATSILGKSLGSVSWCKTHNGRNEAMKILEFLTGRNFRVTSQVKSSQVSPNARRRAQCKGGGGKEKNIQHKKCQILYNLQASLTERRRMSQRTHMFALRGFAPASSRHSASHVVVCIVDVVNMHPSHLVWFPVKNWYDQSKRRLQLRSWLGLRGNQLSRHRNQTALMHATDHGFSPAWSDSNYRLWFHPCEIFCHGDTQLVPARGPTTMHNSISNMGQPVTMLQGIMMKQVGLPFSNSMCCTLLGWDESGHHLARPHVQWWTFCSWKSASLSFIKFPMSKQSASCKLASVAPCPAEKSGAKSGFVTESSRKWS